MKISEVISNLEEIKAAHGDLKVASYNSNRFDNQAYAVVVSDSWGD